MKPLRATGLGLLVIAAGIVLMSRCERDRTSRVLAVPAESITGERTESTDAREVLQGGRARSTLRRGGANNPALRSRSSEALQGADAGGPGDDPMAVLARYATALDGFEQAQRDALRAVARDQLDLEHLMEVYERGNVELGGIDPVGEVDDIEPQVRLRIEEGQRELKAALGERYPAYLQEVARRMPSI